MPPRKSLNNQHLPNHNQRFPPLALNDNDEFPPSFVQLIESPPRHEEHYLDPYDPLPHSKTSYNNDFINDYENLMRKYPDQMQTSNPTTSQQIHHTSPHPTPNLFRSNPSPINLPHPPFSQQFQKTSSQIPTQTSSKQFQIPYSQIPTQTSSQQFQTTSSQIPTQTFSQQFQTTSSQIPAQTSSQQFRVPSSQFQDNQAPPTNSLKGKDKASPNEGVSKSKWERDEDIALCEIGSNVSDRPKQQRYAGFWKIIVNEYNDRMKHHPNGYRDSKSCQNRWERIKKVAIGWRAAMERVRNENRSGFNELDTITLAKEFYDGNPSNTEKFKHEHIIQHLEIFSKYSWTTTDGSYKTFDDIEDLVTTPNGSSQGSAKRASPFFDEDSHSQGNVEEVSSPAKKNQRPEGVKRQKAKTKAAREIFEGKFKEMDKISEARLIEAQAALKRAEVAGEKSSRKSLLKERKMDEEYMKDRYRLAETEEEKLEVKLLMKQFDEKWGLRRG